MKIFLLAILTLTVAFEASAQRRSGPVGPRYNPSGRVSPGPGPGPRRHHPGTTVVVTPGHDRWGNVVNRPVFPSPRPVGPRYNPPMGRRPVVYRTGPVIRVAPRYVYNSYSNRYIRPVIRQPIIWNQPFSYSCNAYEQLLLNGSYVHDFNFQGECYQAIQDIHVYGDFCDGEDLFDQSGALEAQFTFDYECRDALGYYY